MRVELEQPLSEEQKKLAEHNFRLVWFFISKYPIEGLDEDEYTSRIAKAFIRSMMTYDPAISRVSTYAFRGMHYARREFLSRYAGKKRRREVTSIFGADGLVHEPVAGDIEESRDCRLDHPSKRSVLLSLLHHLTPTQSKVIKLAMEGLTQNQIAQKLSMRVPNVSYSYNMAIKKLRYEMMVCRGMRVEDWI